MREQDNLIGESDRFLAVLDHVSRLAPLNRPVLILGERGTGKELIAQRLHYLSHRWSQPLVSLNCAALSEGLIDSELFGHEAGAFTSAKGRHAGRFERAEGGTLFLDEVGTAPLGVQEKLLRVIEYGEYERVGGSQPKQADVRLICATNEDLPAMATRGDFRPDLLDRLAFDVVHLPPLRERRQDILLLAEHFALKMAVELGYSYFAGFSAQAQAQLLAHPWPGNVRELKNSVERALYRHNDPDTPVESLCLDPFTPPWQAEMISPRQTNAAADNQGGTLPALPVDLREWQTEMEKAMLMAAMTQAKYHQRKAAQLLGLSYHQLRGLLRKHNVGNDEQ
ncbi:MULTISPECIES: phage shock protein operon transcriptional activator [Salinivibrio]|uniref:Phage shock protein operon transcriptional activator n=1 Tax=Salinivibrio proteolyticus TaxID=334715 RepID=A0ABY7LHB8_9GAMM|nr:MULTISPECIES: phage shock protein operon transcriptional activator [Salinivibrio]ODQ00019.1 phage shock protein operon transcriptional activator [Salinivibrio sp. DV]PCE66930.1 phage shock protein operon transcriptional activator [Salinivibrio sp. YCSC6]QCF36172.1 phage shock protein operon transcriptional activator [Salinivibrio sp. YCSC6]WBA15729.1 phage shock protein operon transcriptional activator [Salinivibrio proteolyticus]